jgi:hypothetical protein
MNIVQVGDFGYALHGQIFKFFEKSGNDKGRCFSPMWTANSEFYLHEFY